MPVCPPALPEKGERIFRAFSEDSLLEVKNVCFIFIQQGNRFGLKVKRTKSERRKNLIPKSGHHVGITIYFGSVYFGFAGDMGYFACPLPAIGNGCAGVDDPDISGVRGGGLSSG